MLKLVFLLRLGLFVDHFRSSFPWMPDTWLFRRFPRTRRALKSVLWIVEIKKFDDYVNIYGQFFLAET